LLGKILDADVKSARRALATIYAPLDAPNLLTHVKYVGLVDFGAFTISDAGKSGAARGAWRCIEIAASAL
jgi:hypothetical protein